MTGLEWFLVGLLVAGGIYLLGHRAPKPVPSRYSYPETNSQPQEQKDDASQHARDPNAQQPRRHGGCC